MLDEEGSSSCDNFDEVENEQGKSQDPQRNGNCTTTSSSGSESQMLVGKDRSGTTYNPFAINQLILIQNVTESANKEPRSLLAPPLLKFESDPSEEKLQLYNSIQPEEFKSKNKLDCIGMERKEYSSRESTIAQIPRSGESDGRMSKDEFIPSYIFASSDKSFKYSLSKTSWSDGNTFGVCEKKSDGKRTYNEGFIFGQNLHERVICDKIPKEPLSPTDSHILPFEGGLKKEKSKQDSVTKQFTSNENYEADSSYSHRNQKFKNVEEKINKNNNPFAIKSLPLIKSAVDTTNKGPRPLLARPTLNFIPEIPTEIPHLSTSSIQDEKWKQVNKPDSTSKQEREENSSDDSNVAKMPRLSKSNELSYVDFLPNDLASVSNSFSSKPSCFDGNTGVSDRNVDEKPTNWKFIFGQNLHERIVNYEKKTEEASPLADSQNLTFEEAALKKEESEIQMQNREEKLKRSLSDFAKEYETKQVKCKFDEVVVITGEEEEHNVLQINCKLFAFDATNMNWQERGRGTLRLNDKECEGKLQTRVVMRMKGNLEVILNTKVWKGMSVEQPSEKTVQLTAYDPQGVTVFRLMAQPHDARELFHALKKRLDALKSQDTNTAILSLQNDEINSTSRESVSSSTLFDECSQDSFSNEGCIDSLGEGDMSSETCFALCEASTDVAFDDASDSIQIQV